LEHRRENHENISKKPKTRQNIILLREAIIGIPQHKQRIINHVHSEKNDPERRKHNQRKRVISQKNKNKKKEHSQKTAKKHSTQGRKFVPRNKTVQGQREKESETHKSHHKYQFRVRKDAYKGYNVSLG